MITRLPNIFLIGPMGSGKTTIGKRLASGLGLEFYDSDTEIEVRTGVTIAWIFDVEGEKGFRKREQQIINELTGLTGVVLATGGGVILQSENRSNLSARGIVVYLQASVEQQLQRTQLSRTRPLLSEAPDPKNTLEFLQDHRQQLYQEIADFIVNTDNRSVQMVVSDIITYVRGRFHDAS